MLPHRPHYLGSSHGPQRPKPRSQVFSGSLTLTARFPSSSPQTQSIQHEPRQHPSTERFYVAPPPDPTRRAHARSLLPAHWRQRARLLPRSGGVDRWGGSTCEELKPSKSQADAVPVPAFPRATVGSGPGWAT